MKSFILLLFIAIFSKLRNSINLINDRMNRRYIIYCLLFLLLCNASFGQKLSSAQQIADFDTLCTNLECVHPDLYLYQSRKEYENNKAQIKASLTDSISTSDFYLKIAPFMAKIKDGHSMMLPPITKTLIAYAKKDGNTMPLRIKASGDFFIVEYPVIDNSGVCEGDTILGINGIRSKDILERMYSLWGSEKGNGIKEGSVNAYWSPLLWYMYRWGESYDFTVKRGDKMEEIRMEGVRQSVALKVIKERQSKKKLESFSCSFSSDFTKATLTIRNVFQNAELKAFCDSVFKEIHRRKIKDITIDLRNNTSGSSKCVERLISYFPHPDYSLYSESQLKVSSYSKIYNRGRHPEIYSQICNLPDRELFVIKDIPVKSNLKEVNLYHGKTTILVNNKTYSGASTLAHTMKKLGIASVEGETGCPDVYFGNSLHFTLPNSKIDYYISLSKFYESTQLTK